MAARELLLDGGYGSSLRVTSESGRMKVTMITNGGAGNTLSVVLDRNQENLLFLWLKGRRNAQ
ncbi:MAG TPA: hypothetical protein VGP94_13965 [Tepidisphaeraceae bacterium]|jgi:hypothetical protein|nr:hypothetical protein [Tepidisphaeraceae bacterium]